MACSTVGMIFFIASFSTLWIHGAGSAQEKSDLFKEFWEWRLLNAPEFATFIGEHKYDDYLDDMSLAAYERRLGESKALLAKVQNALHHASSSEKEDLKLLQYQLSISISGQKYKSYVWPMNNLEGPHVDFPRLLMWMKKDTVDDFRKILTRMRLFSNQIDQSILLMKEGIRLGLTMHATSVGPLPQMLKNIAAAPLEKLAVLEPFKTRPKTISKRGWRRLKYEAHGVVKRIVQPTYLRLANFIEKTYAKHTRANIGASTLPGGKEYYAGCLRYHTSTNLTAEQIHGIGTFEVLRITKRMEKIKDAVKFKGNLKDFKNYLRTDPKFNYSTGEEVINDYRQKGKKAHSLLSKYFSVLPKAPYALVPVPADVAPYSPAAYYLAPPGDGSRPGTFFVNTYKPESRKTYSTTSTCLHEAEPGHHLQGTLTIENGSPLAFRRFMEDRKYYEVPSAFPKYTAYTEGWGLYAEYVGEEMDMYADNYALFGRLSDEMLRATRLVVDTGMHALGWSKQKAIDYMLENTAGDIEGIKAEVNRYVTWPGQACGYKMGEIKIKQVRRKAEKALGKKFDLKMFHSMVASMGGVPLDYLEEQVDDFIKKYQA